MKSSEAFTYPAFFRDALYIVVKLVFDGKQSIYYCIWFALPRLEPTTLEQQAGTSKQLSYEVLREKGKSLT
jgi:hypothetical protein